MIETELALMPTSTADDPAVSPTMGSSSAQVFGFGYRVHALVNILTGRVRPFILFGGGGLTSSTSDPDIVRQDTTGSLDVGGGLKVDIRSNWGLRLDGRALFVPGGAGQSLVADGEVLLGLYGRFGDKKAGMRDDPDDDKDGVPNRDDLCPNVPGLKDNKGCPPDSDGDGVPDLLDKCPHEKGIVQFKGCLTAANLDSDEDGIADDQDKCPDAAETKNGYQDEDGCPDQPLPAALTPFVGTIVGVTFEPERTELTPTSLPILDKAVAALRENPTIKLEIAGYTDNSGELARNLELSQKRAEAVKAYLVSQGIDAARLTSKGFGQESPIADNANPEGREKNRRVEFHFLN
jgi:OOP family OmpA-OmpF porin